ncbi:MAG TPA: hypothetical protein VFK13_12420 [Gemmatimonadaceae bacterium]|nr:hypothetical protein [Gemmatimonadaceae bacterium]
MNLTPTPYELVIAPLEESVFPAIRSEAEQRGTDPRRRDQFILLGHVGATLAAMEPEDAPPDALQEYAEVLYQGFQFWRWGRRLYVFDETVTAALLAPRVELRDWELAAPPACYLRFPYQRLWARVADEALFEPLDGCFVTCDDRDAQGGGPTHLRVLAVLGARSERAGLSLVTHTLDLAPADVSRSADAPWRDGAPPFANALPGGERNGYRAVVTISELEALVLRALHHLDRHSETLTAEPPPAGERHTHLAYTAVHAAG